MDSIRTLDKTLVILFGPPAVGKMSVGVALSKLTGLPLFHNHVPIEMVLRYFAFGSDAYNRLVPEIRRRIFEEVAGSDLPGLIFTFVWDLDDADDKAFIDRLTAIFTSRGGRVCFVELATTLEERLRRNETPERLAEKPSKRDTVKSRERLLAADGEYRMNSRGDFIYPDVHQQIENTELPAQVVAEQIVAQFDLHRLNR